MRTRPLRLLLRAAVIGAACIGLGGGVAQAATQIQVRPGLNGQVSKITAPDANGIRYVAGQFTRLNPWDTGSMAVFSPGSGELDRSFPKVGGGGIAAVAPDRAGGVYIGGGFTCVGGDGGSDGDCSDAGEFSRAGLAHVRADGSVDANWAPVPAGPSTPFITALATSPDGLRVYIGGSFASMNGSARTNMALLKSDGTLDPTWAPPFVSSIPGAMAVVPSTGEVAVGGSFEQVGGIARKRLVLLDGSGTGALAPVNDTAGEVPGFGLGDGAVLSIAVRGTTIYVGGSFTKTTGLVTRNRMAAFSTAGSLLTWDPSVTGSSTGKGVKSLAFSPAADTIFAAGTFGKVGGVDRTNMAEIRLDTGAPTPWNEGMLNAGTHSPIGPNGEVDALVLSASGDTAYVAGNFSVLGAAGGFVRRNYLASLTTAGRGSTTSWDPHPGGAAGQLVLTDSHLFVGGTFDAMGGTPREGLAAVDPSGAFTDWAPLAQDGEVRDIALDGNAVYIVGLFDYVNDTLRRGLARITTAGVGTLDTSWTPSTSSGSADAVAVRGTAVYIGGTFTHVNGAGNLRTNLAAVSTTDGSILNWEPDAYGSVTTIATTASAVYVSGDFLSVTGAASRPRMAAFDPNPAGPGTLLAFNPELNSIAYSILPAGSTVYIGGAFTTVKGLQRKGVAAVDPATGVPTGFNADVPGFVGTLALRGSTLYVGGAFTTAGGQPRAHLAAVDSGTGGLLPWDPGADDTVYTVDVDDQAVWAGGQFDRIGGASSPRLARVGFDGKTIVPAGTGVPVTAPAITTAGSAPAVSTVTSVQALRPRAMVRVRVTRFRSFANLARDNGLRPVLRGTIKVRVARASRRVCVVRGTSVRALRRGLCRYTVSTHRPNGVRVARASWSFLVVPRGASIALR